MAQIIKDWTKYLIPQENYIDEVDEFGNSYKTTDLVTTMLPQDLNQSDLVANRKSLTDFAVANRGYGMNGYLTHDWRRSGGWWLLPEKIGFDDSCAVDHVPASGALKGMYQVHADKFGILPRIQLKLPRKMTIDEISKEIGEFKKVESEDGLAIYKKIKLGEYPKTKVSDELQKELEEKFNYGFLMEGLECTGRLFTTNGHTTMDYTNFLSKQNPEFEYKGDRYVRTTINCKMSDSIYEDGREVPTTISKTGWFKVEPITFRINNFIKYSFQKTDYLDLVSDQLVLAGLPFYPYTELEHEWCSLWQNSLIRTFMNSDKSSDLDGNQSCLAPLKWDFRKSGFLYQALNMTREATREYVVPEGETEVCDFAFRGCVGLNKIVIPSHVTKIGCGAFDDCRKTQLVFENPNKKLEDNQLSRNHELGGYSPNFTYLTKDGSKVILSPYEDDELKENCFKFKFSDYDLLNYLNNNYRENFVQFNLWKDEKKIKFIPPENILQTFPSSEIKNYIVNNNHQRWGKLIKSLGFDKLEGQEKTNSTTDLLKVYYAIGGFSENQGESEKAYDYIRLCVAVSKSGETDPSYIGSLIHSRFSRLMLNGAYNPTFAQFFMKYYHQDSDFMVFQLEDKDGDLMEEQDYICLAHNSFATIQKNYPNRVVNGNEERALLTPRFVAEHSCVVEYEDVDEGNERLADMIGRYGYSQEQFDEMQEVFNKAKKVKSIITADESHEESVVTYRVLDKDDEEGFIIGDVCNCCQHFGREAESCVEDGYLNPKAGFIVFEHKNSNPDKEEKRIVGEAYMWYDPETKTVCFDNIEVPTKVLKELKKDNKKEDELSFNNFVKAVINSADAIMYDMNRNGIEVQRVTTGKGYNDLATVLEKSFGKAEFNPIAKHRNYSGYSDANSAQYLIRTYDQTKQYYSSSDAIEVVACENLELEISETDSVETMSFE